MSGLAQVLGHHLERIAKAAGATFGGDCRGELRAECEAIERRFERLEERAGMLEEINALRHRVDELENLNAERERTALWSGGK